MRHLKLKLQLFDSRICVTSHMYHVFFRLVKIKKILPILLSIKFQILKRLKM